MWKKFSTHTYTHTHTHTYSIHTHTYTVTHTHTHIHTYIHTHTCTHTHTRTSREMIRMFCSDAPLLLFYEIGLARFSGSHLRSASTASSSSVKGSGEYLSVCSRTSPTRWTHIFRSSRVQYALNRVSMCEP